MREITVDELEKRLANTSRNLLFLASPNFESRSLTWVDTARKICSLRPSAHMLVGMVTLQGGILQNLVLERLRGYHIQEAKQRLKQQDSLQFTLKHESFSYPHDLSPGDLDGVIRAWLDILSTPSSVCFDITALPRKVIVPILDTLKKLAGESKIDQLLLMYTWAKHYPRAGRQANVGSLVVIPGNSKLSLFIDSESDIKGVLIAGREAYAGRLFFDSLPNAQVDAYIHLAKEEPLSAMQTVYANSTLLATVESRSDSSLNYFLSIARGHEMLVANALRARSKWEASPQRQHRTYLVAPFGNKPSLVSAFIACQIVSRAADKTGIVVASQHQYGDLYSVGWRNTSYYEVALNELRGDV